jgi:hypothetical protein
VLAVTLRQVVGGFVFVAAAVGVAAILRGLCRERRGLPGPASLGEAEGADDPGRALRAEGLVFYRVEAEADLGAPGGSHYKVFCGRCGEPVYVGPRLVGGWRARCAGCGFGLESERHPGDILVELLEARCPEEAEPDAPGAGQDGEPLR